MILTSEDGISAILLRVKGKKFNFAKSTEGRGSGAPLKVFPLVAPLCGEYVWVVLSNQSRRMPSRILLRRRRDFSFWLGVAKIHDPIKSDSPK